MKQFIDDNKSTIKLISLIVGGVTIFVAGLIFVVITDLKLKNTSTWLFISIIFSFGSGIANMLSDNIKEKPIPYYILKGLGVLLAIGYLVFLSVFAGSDFAAAVDSKVRDVRDLAIVLSRVFCIIAIAAQAVNVVFAALTRKEETA